MREPWEFPWSLALWALLGVKTKNHCIFFILKKNLVTLGMYLLHITPEKNKIAARIFKN
jgi:hypothetical protein